jgi:hypothetical protein
VTVAIARGAAVSKTGKTGRGTFTAIALKVTAGEKPRMIKRFALSLAAALFTFEPQQQRKTENETSQ